MVRGDLNGRDVLMVGVPVDRTTGAPEPGTARLFDGPGALQIHPLAGFGLPYDDGAVQECRLLAPVTRLSPRYRDAILAEAERVARKVVTAADGTPA